MSKKASKPSTAINKSTPKVIKLNSRDSTEKLKFDLIEYVKDHRYVWDQTDKDYNRNDKKNKVYSNFAKLNSSLSETINEQNVKATWNSLRTAFNREYSRLNKPKLTGSPGDDDEIIESKWSFYDSMIFLKENHDAVEDEESIQQFKDNDELKRDDVRIDEKSNQKDEIDEQLSDLQSIESFDVEDPNDLDFKIEKRNLFLNLIN